MALPWVSRMWARIFPASQTTEADDEQQEERFAEARRAVAEGERYVAQADRLAPEVGATAERLRIRSSHNHFSELVQQALQDGYHPRHAPERRGS